MSNRKFDVKQTNYSAFAGKHCLRITVSDSSGLGFDNPVEADKVESLVNAAPEMLHALKDALEWMRRYAPPESNFYEITQVKAAINKAEGK